MSGRETAAGTALRIAYCINDLEASCGAADRAAMLVSRSLDAGHEVTVICGAEAASRAALPEAELIALPRGRGAVQQMLALRGAVRQAAPDIFHGLDLFGICGSLAARNVAAGVVCSLGFQPSLLPRGKQLLTRYSCLKADRVLTPSEAIDFWCRDCWGLPADKLTTVPHFIDCGAVPARDPVMRRRVRESLGLRPEQPVLLHLGPMLRHAAHVHMIDAAAICRAAYPDAVWLFVGDGPLRAELETLAADCGVAGRCRFLGDRDDVLELLQAADLFLLPSLAEAMSSHLLLAMASGLPAIGSIVPGNTDLIQPGQTGWLIPKDDPEALAEAVAEALSDPAWLTALGAAGRQRIGETYDAGDIAARHLELYEQVLAGEPVVARQ